MVKQFTKAYLVESPSPLYKERMQPRVNMEVVDEEEQEYDLETKPVEKKASIADWFSSEELERIQKLALRIEQFVIKIADYIAFPEDHPQEHSDLLKIIEKGGEPQYVFTWDLFPSYKYSIVITQKSKSNSSNIEAISANISVKEKSINIFIPLKTLLLYASGKISKSIMLRELKKILTHEMAHAKDPKLTKNLNTEKWKNKKYEHLPWEEDAFVAEFIPELTAFIERNIDRSYVDVANEAYRMFKVLGHGVKEHQDKEKYKRRMKKFMKVFDTVYNRIKQKKAAFLKGFTKKTTSAESTFQACGLCLRRALEAIDNDPKLRLVMGPPGQPGDTSHFWTLKQDGSVYDPTPEAVTPDYKYEGRIVDPQSIKEELGIIRGVRVFTKVEAARWTDEELDILKTVYREARDQGIPHNQIYQRLSDYLPHSRSGIKQKLEALYQQDEKLSKYKFESWNRERILDELERLYSSGEPVSRKLLPPKLEYQITNHSLPKAITRGFEVYFDSFDHAVAEAILNVGFARDDNGKLIKEHPISDIEEAWHYYRGSEKINNPWTKKEIIRLFKKAHEAGLPLTKSFFTGHPEVYKSLIGVSRSLDGLRKSIDRLGYTWGELVIEAVPDYAQWYDESGTAKNSMGELRVMRFLDLHNIPYRNTTKADKIPVTEPRLLEVGYRNFVPDLFILDDKGREIALVEVYGAIANSGAADGELQQKYQEKILAKEIVYEQLPIAYIAIHDNSLYGSDLTDEKLIEKFEVFLPETAID